MSVCRISSVSNNDDFMSGTIILHFKIRIRRRAHLAVTSSGFAFFTSTCRPSILCMVWLLHKAAAASGCLKTRNAKPRDVWLNLHRTRRRSNVIRLSIASLTSNFNVLTTITPPYMPVITCYTHTLTCCSRPQHQH